MPTPTTNWKEATDSDAGTSAKYGAPDVKKISQVFNGDLDVDDLEFNSEIFFRRTKLFLLDTSADHSIQILTSEETGDRTLTIPVLGANDTIATLGLAQTFTADKTFDGGNLVFGTTPATAGNIRMEEGDIISWNTTGATEGTIGYGINAGNQFFTFNRNIRIIDTLQAGFQLERLGELSNGAEIGNFNFRAEDGEASPVIQVYTKIMGIMADDTAGLEEGELRIQLMDSGAPNQNYIIFNSAGNNEIDLFKPTTLPTNTKLFFDSGDNTSIRESSADIITFEAGGNDLVSIDGISGDINLFRDTTLKTTDIKTQLTLYDDVVTPTDDISTGQINFNADTDTTENVQYAIIRCGTRDVTNATSSGEMELRVREDDQPTTYLTLDGELEEIQGFKNTELQLVNGILNLYSPSSTANDGWNINFSMDNTTPAEVIYASIGARVRTSTPASEDGRIDFSVMDGGSLVKAMEITAQGTTNQLIMTAGFDITLQTGAKLRLDAFNGNTSIRESIPDQITIEAGGRDMFSVNTTRSTFGASASANEGGEFILSGEGANTDVTMDNFAGFGRIIVNSSSDLGFEIVNIGSGDIDYILAVDSKVRFDGAIAGDTHMSETVADDLLITVGGGQAIRMNEDGTEIDVVFGANNVLAVGATAGFVFIPNMAGAPTGNPTVDYTGKTAMVYDTTNDVLYANRDGTATGWQVVGITTEGTSFPSTFPTDEIFYRSDWHREYYNNGTEGTPTWEGVNVLVGEVKMYGGAEADVPTGWFLCDGQAVSRTTYAELFDRLGTEYGVGDGSTTFNVPDFQSENRFPRGATNDAGRGGEGGEGTHVLTVGELAQHTHTQNQHNHFFAGGGPGSGGVNLAGTGGGSPTVSNTTATNQNTGSDTAHENKPPFLDFHFIIAV